MKITHIVMHYSATYPDQSFTAADIDRMHKQRGFRKIGYHYFIRRDGTVEKGREETEVGAHVGGQNQGKLGICLEGGLDRKSGINVGVDNRTVKQKASAAALVKRLYDTYNKPIVCGHLDLANTQCPAYDAGAWFAKEVMGAKNVKPAPTRPMAPVITENVREDRFHVVERGDTWWGISQAYGLTLAELLRLNNAKSSDTLSVGRRVATTEEAPPMNPPAGFWESIFAILFGRK